MGRTAGISLHKPDFLASPSHESLKSALKNKTPLLWLNPGRTAQARPGSTWQGNPIAWSDALAAAERFKRFAPVLRALFPEELKVTGGVIESELLPATDLALALGLEPQEGRLFVKADHSLPVAGSIKARGGFHEVLEFAENLAQRHGLLQGDDPSSLLAEKAKALFARYRIAVGSTGNLGLSIGVIASALGFRATVHMSADAKEWKKERLRRRGVEVVEHTGDYAAAVAAGRLAAEADPLTHFVDDEQSSSLFLGYAAAALGLRDQLAGRKVIVDSDNPLFVYIPCGVGGAPGGIAYGLAHLYGPYVHCFFAEPTASPCFLVAMQDTSGAHPSVYDLGLDNRTEADGLAVPQASACAVQTMRESLAGVFTIGDEALFPHVRRAADAQGLRVEPSATAAFDGPSWICSSEAGRRYLASQGLTGSLSKSTHVVWTTGGSLVPEDEYQRFLARGVVSFREP